MRSCTFLLVRHAHANDRDRDGHPLLCGWHDIPLSDFGRAQAGLLGEKLRHEDGLAAAYSSPLQRACDTALAASGHLSQPLMPELREIHCGRLEGIPLAAVRAQYGDLWQANEAQSNDDFRWPGGETYRELRCRALMAMRRMAADHPGRRVLVFTHSGIISQVLGFLAGIRPAAWDCYRPGNASITEVEWAGDHGRLLHFDDRRHLKGLGGEANFSSTRPLAR